MHRFVSFFINQSVSCQAEHFLFLLLDLGYQFFPPGLSDMDWLIRLDIGWKRYRNISVNPGPDVLECHVQRRDTLDCPKVSLASRVLNLFAL